MPCMTRFPAVFLDILHDHAVITAKLINANRLSIEHVLFEDGWLKVFTTVKDCQDHMHRNYKDKSAETGQYCKIQAILFEDVIAIADEHHLDVIIDEPAEQGELMMIYRHEKRMLMAEVAVNLNSLFKLLGKCKVGRKKE